MNSGGRERAIYQDALGRFRDLYFDRFPRFVVHSSDKPIDPVHFWLYDDSDEEFEAFLNTHIKGELKLYPDGRAITRFRERICG